MRSQAANEADGHEQRVTRGTSGPSAKRARLQNGVARQDNEEQEDEDLPISRRKKVTVQNSSRVKLSVSVAAPQPGTSQRISPVADGAAQPTRSRKAVAKNRDTSSSTVNGESDTDDDGNGRTLRRRKMKIEQSTPEQSVRSDEEQDSADTENEDSPDTRDKSRTQRRRKIADNDESDDAPDREDVLQKKLDKQAALTQRTERRVQRIARPRVLPGPKLSSRYATAGVIERVELTNFLCHEHLEIDLHPHVNFVTGRNGSGKSAILAAIIVGLGGQAKHTGRAQSLKDFVRHSKTSAEVCVTIANRGDDAYRHDEYGDKITVMRTITLSKDGQASGSYRIYGASTRAARSSRKDELDSILDHFNIYVDNPAVLLTQETARTFLATQKPEDRYKFLMDGALITRLEEEYEATSQLRDVFTKQMGKRAKLRLHIEAEKKQAEQQMSAVRRLDELERQARRLQLEIAFAEARDARTQLERATGARADLAKQLDSRTQQLTEFKEKIKQLEKQKTECDNKCLAMAAALDQIKEQGKETRTQLQVKDSEIETAQNDIEDMKRQSNAVSRTIVKMEDRIREMQSNERNSDLLRQRAEHDKRVETLNGEIEDMRNRIRNLEQQRDAAPAGGDTRRELLAAEARRRFVFQEIQQRQSVLDGLRRAASGATRQNSLVQRACVFHPAHAHILRIIDAQPPGTFRAKPIGPLGAYLRIRDSRWTVVAHQSLSSLFSSYVVTCSSDQQALSRVFREVRAECNRQRQYFKPFGIIIQAFRQTVYDTASQRPVSNYPTLLEMLQIENPVVANVFIDQANIERTLLIANPEECRRVMRAPPRNVAKAYDTVGTQVMPAPNFRTYGADADRSRCHLIPSCDAENDTRESEAQLSTELRRLNEELSECDALIKVKNNELANAERARQSVDVEVRRLLSTLNEKRVALSELRNQVPVDVVSSLDALREEHAARISERDRLNEKLDDRNRFITAAKNERQALSTRLNELKARDIAERQLAEPIRERRNAIIEELDATRESQNRFTATLKESDARRSREDETVRKLETRLNETLAAIETSLAEYKRIAGDDNGLQDADVQALRDTQARIDELRSRLKQCETERSARAKQITTPKEEIERQYASKRDAFRKADEALSTGRNLIRTMKEAQRVRAERLADLRSEITDRVISRFKQTVTLRGFPCQMRADHEAKRLHLFVDPNVCLNPETLFATQNNNNTQSGLTDGALQAPSGAKRRGLLSNDALRGTQTQRLAEVSQLVAQSNSAGGGARVQTNTKGYSGGERSFTTVNFLLALWEAIETPIRCMDEFDVYMDIYNRRFCIELLKVVAGHDRTKQYIFLTPQDLSQVELNDDCRLVRMRDHHVDAGAAAGASTQ